MSYKRPGQLTQSTQRAKHLRPIWKRLFHKGERRAFKSYIIKQLTHEDI